MAGGGGRKGEQQAEAQRSLASRDRHAHRADRRRGRLEQSCAARACSPRVGPARRSRQRQCAQGRQTPPPPTRKRQAGQYLRVVAKEWSLSPRSRRCEEKGSHLTENGLPFVERVNYVSGCYVELRSVEIRSCACHPTDNALGRAASLSRRLDSCRDGDP